MTTSKLNILFFGIILGLIIMATSDTSNSIALFVGMGMSMVCLAASLIFSMRMLFNELDNNRKVNKEDRLRHSRKAIWWVAAFGVLIVARIVLVFIDNGMFYEDITPFLRMMMSAVIAIPASIGSYYAICAHYGKDQLAEADKNIKLVFFASEFIFFMLIQP